VLVPVDRTELPLIHQKYEDMDWVRELAGLLIVRVEQESDTETTVTFELQSDPEPMFQELASDWVVETSEYFERQRVARARQRARELTRTVRTSPEASAASVTAKDSVPSEAQDEQMKPEIMPPGSPDTQVEATLDEGPGLNEDLVSKETQLRELISRLEEEGHIHQARGKSKPDPAAIQGIKELLSGLNVLDKIELLQKRHFTNEDTGTIIGYSTSQTKRMVRKLTEHGRLP
jgi:hypothetical protein